MLGNLRVWGQFNKVPDMSEHSYAALSLIFANRRYDMVSEVLCF